jgi:fatty acid desaturase
MVAAHDDEADLAPATDADTDPLGRVDRRQLVDSRGVAFAEFRRTLKPRFGRVWLEIAAGYLVLIVLSSGLFWAQSKLGAWALLLVPPAGFAVGLSVHFINMFMHEAAHYGLAPSRVANDRLANAFVTILIGQDVRRYRAIHFDHHRHLGTVRDTERAYFARMSPRFLLEALTGIQALRVVALNRGRAGAKLRPSGGLLHRQLVLGVLLHALLLGTALYFGYYVFAAAWLVGLGGAFPFFTAVRQVLEHRSEAASRSVDYAAQDHGPCNRLFGAGPFASIFGGVGFNRHMLHHWEPQISYTCLAALERYLRDTCAAPALAQRHISYGRVLRQLLSEHERPRA